MLVRILPIKLVNIVNIEAVNKQNIYGYDVDRGFNRSDIDSADKRKPLTTRWTITLLYTYRLKVTRHCSTIDKVNTVSLSFCLDHSFTELVYLGSMN